MPPFSGSSATVLRPAVGTWTLAGPAMASFSVGNLGNRVSGTMPVVSSNFAVGEDGSVRDVHAVLDIASIDTGPQQPRCGPSEAEFARPSAASSAHLQRHPGPPVRAGLDGHRPADSQGQDKGDHLGRVRAAAP